MPTIVSFDRRPTSGGAPIEELPRENNNLFVMRHVRSSHHTLGAVVGRAKNHILQLFPTGFFKHVHIGTNMASVSGGKPKGDLNTWRKMSPSLAIIPTFSPQDSLFANEPVHTFIRWKDGLPPPVKGWEGFVEKLFYHETTGKQIYFNVARLKLSMEIAFRVGTEIRGWDMVALLRRKMRPGYYFYDNLQLLPVEIPNVLTTVLAAEMGIDLKTTAGATEMEARLNRFGRYRFRRDKNPATGNECFFVDYPANLLYKLDGDYAYDKGLIGKSQEKTVVTATLTCEFTVPDTFAVSTFDPITENFMDRLGMAIQDFSYLNVQLAPTPPLHIGNLTLQHAMKFISDGGITDSLDATQGFPRLFADFIKAEHIAGRSDAMHMAVWDVHGPLPSDAYSVDYLECKVTLFAPLPSQIYYVGLYLDMQKVRNFAAPAVNERQTKTVDLSASFAEVGLTAEPHDPEVG